MLDWLTAFMNATGISYLDIIMTVFAVGVAPVLKKHYEASQTAIKNENASLDEKANNYILGALSRGAELALNMFKDGALSNKAAMIAYMINYAKEGGQDSMNHLSPSEDRLKQMAESVLTQSTVARAAVEATAATVGIIPASSVGKLLTAVQGAADDANAGH